MRRAPLDARRPAGVQASDIQRVRITLRRMFRAIAFIRDRLKLRGWIAFVPDPGGSGRAPSGPPRLGVVSVAPRSGSA